MSCIYSRDTSNDQTGRMFSHIHTAAGSETIELGVYRGDGVSPVSLGGANVDGSTPSGTIAKLVVIKLASGASVVTDTNAGEGSQSIQSGSAVLSGVSVAAPATADMLLGANIGGAYASNSGSRYQADVHVRVDGADIFDDGNYGRGDQGTQDTFGYSANPIGFAAATSGDTIDLRKQTTGDSAPMATNDGWVGIWGIDLDSLQSAVSETVETDESAQSQAVANVTLSQNYVLSAASVSQGQRVDNADLTQGYNLGAQGSAQGQGVDNTALTQGFNLSAQDSSQGQFLANTSLSQGIGLNLADVAQANGLDSVELTQSHVIAIADSAQAQSLAASALVEVPILTIAGSGQAQASSNIVLAAAQSLALQDVSQRQGSAVIALTQNYVLAINDALQGQSIGSLILGVSLTPQDSSQSAVLDSTTLQQSAFLLAVDDLTQSQLVESLSITPIVVGKLLGEVVIYAAMNGGEYVTPALNAEGFRIYH
jgi:hypothetical protein